MALRRAIALGLFVAGGGASFAAVAVIPVLTGAGCSHEPAAASTSVAPIVIGVSLGLASSDLASLAGPMKNGVKVAEAQVNASGGLLGRPVEYRIADDQGDTGSILQGVIDGFLDASAVSVLGPITSQQVANVQMDLAQHKTLEISASATAIDLADAQPPTDRYFFRTVPSDELQGKAIALFARTGTAAVATASDAGTDADADAGTGATGATGTAPTAAADSGAGGSTHVACTNMAIVNNSDAYGEGLYNAVASSLTALGGTVVAHVEVSPLLASSYSDQVSQILAASPDCLGLFTYDDVGPRFLSDLANARQLAPSALPSSFFVVGSDGLFDQGFITNGQLDPGDPSRGNVTDGVYGTSPDSTPPTPEYNSFLELYNASFPLGAGAVTGQYVSNIYDAAILVALAIEQAGGIGDPVKIRDSLYSVSSGGTSYGPTQLNDALRAIREGQDVDYDGASGSCDFDAEGNVVSNYIVWQVQNGQFSNPPVTRIQASDLK